MRNNHAARPFLVVFPRVSLKNVASTYNAYSGSFCRTTGQCDDEKLLIAKGVRDRINLILQNIRGLITKWNGINLSYLWKVRLNI